MEQEVVLVKKEAQPVLSIRTRSSVQNLPKVIGECYGQIIEYLTSVGQQPSSAPFVAYYNEDMQDLDLEIGFPVATVVESKGNIQFSKIPEGNYVSYLYKGSYEDMKTPYSLITKWMAEKGYTPLGVSYEYYLNDPTEVPASELLTKIELLVK